MPQPISETVKQQWKENITKQRESGFSIAFWCLQNNIADHVFYYWRRKLFSEDIPKRSTFTELTIENKNVKSGITIEFKGILVHLDREFDNTTLKQSLEIIGKISC